jgi:hypothetical protein
MVVATASAFVPPQPLAQQHMATSAASVYATISTSPLFALQQKDNEVAIGSKMTDSAKSNNNLLVKIWNRMDTLEASGINKEFAEHPPLVSRGGGFKRFMIIMAVGMAYKWYRARFINKVTY